MKQEYEYDVALSFAGEDRIYAEKLASKLRDKGIQVFYDNWNIASLWGDNLYTYLAETYRNKALFCVTIISKAYCEKKWTLLELEFIQERELQGEIYWLPLLLENIKVPGLSETRGKVYASQYTLDEIIDFLLEKISKKKYNMKLQASRKTMKLSLINEQGEDEEVDVVIAFQFRDNKKEYVVYTKNEVDDEGNVTVYVSNVDRTSEKMPRLLGIDDIDEWNRVKSVLRKLSNMDSDSETDRFDDDGIEIL